MLANARYSPVTPGRAPATRDGARGWTPDPEEALFARSALLLRDPGRGPEGARAGARGLRGLLEGAPPLAATPRGRASCSQRAKDDGGGGRGQAAPRLAGGGAQGRRARPGEAVTAPRPPAARPALTPQMMEAVQNTERTPELDAGLRQAARRGRGAPGPRPLPGRAGQLQPGGALRAGERARPLGHGLGAGAAREAADGRAGVGGGGERRPGGAGQAGRHAEAKGDASGARACGSGSSRHRARGLARGRRSERPTRRHVDVHVDVDIRARGLRCHGRSSDQPRRQQVLHVEQAHGLALGVHHRQLVDAAPRACGRRRPAPAPRADAARVPAHHLAHRGRRSRCCPARPAGAGRRR